MSSIILEAKSLTKEYKQTLALDHINLQIKKGKIYGFIGQNGAGKTTFLRLVTGLAFPTSGTLSLWGNSGTEELQKQRKRIGSMIETPALFPSMTAYQNMEVQRIQRGIPDKSVIKRTLDMVGLQDTGKKSVRNFSLGMRQRLGIAIALLNTPELLILDEPINGLDPAGIVEIRNLLKILNKEYGMTILVSSHILEELYQTASEFILIDHGKIIEEISDYELNERCKRHIAIKTTDVQKTVLVLEENLHTDNFKLMPDGIIRLYDYLNDLETVASALAESHILVTGLSGIFNLLLSSILLLDSKERSSNLIMASLYNIPLLYFLIIVFIALFIGSDFSGRTLNTYITAGHKRSSIFRVKLIVSQIGCIIILVFPLFVHGIISQFYIEEKLFWNDSTYTMVLLTLFAMITLCALPMFFAFIFRDMGKTLTVSMVLFFVMIFLLNSESAQIISRIIPMGQLRLISLQKVYSTNFCLFVDFLWNFILYFIAGSAFLHTDLK